MDAEKNAQNWQKLRVRKNTPLFHENTPLFHFFFTFIFCDFFIFLEEKRKNQLNPIILQYFFLSSPLCGEGLRSNFKAIEGGTAWSPLGFLWTYFRTGIDTPLACQHQPTRPPNRFGEGQGSRPSCLAFLVPAIYIIYINRHKSHPQSFKIGYLGLKHQAYSQMNMLLQETKMKSVGNVGLELQAPCGWCWSKWMGMLQVFNSQSSNLGFGHPSAPLL